MIRSRVLLLVLVIVLWPAIAAAGPPPPSPQIARIYLESEADTARLSAMLLDLLEARGPDYLLALVSPTEVARLRRLGWRVEVDAAHTANLHAAALPQLFRDGYLTVDEIEAHLHTLAETYPDLAELIDYGDSWEKTQNPEAGHDLWALRLTRRDRPDPKPAFVIFAAVHARELVPTEIALRFAETLLANYGRDPDATWLLDYQDTWIIPVANPDGRVIVEAGYYQRKNTNQTAGDCGGWPTDPAGIAPGVDLNRNSAFQWGGPGSSTFPCSQVYRGSLPASEPETQALQALMAVIFPDRRPDDLETPAPMDMAGMAISLHSFGRLVLRPWAFSGALPPNADDLTRLSDRMGALMGYLSCQTGMPGCLYAASGTNDDWAYGTLGVPAFTFELGDQFFEPYPAVEGLWRTVAPALWYAARVTYAPYLLSRGPDTEAVELSTTISTTQPLTITARLARGSAPAAIAAGEAFIDAPPWSGALPVPLQPADPVKSSSEITVTGVISAGQLTPGHHLIFVRGLSVEGDAGPPSASFVEVYAPPPVTYRTYLVNVQVSDAHAITMTVPG